VVPSHFLHIGPSGRNILAKRKLAINHNQKKKNNHRPVHSHIQQNIYWMAHWPHPNWFDAPHLIHIEY